MRERRRHSRPTTEGRGINGQGGRQGQNADTKRLLPDSREEKMRRREEHKKLLLLPKDTFSFFAYVEFGSKSFVLAFLVLLVQVLTLSFLMADGIDLEDDKNPLNIPASVTGEVLACQFLALLIAVLSQTDLIASTNLFYNGYRVTSKEDKDVVDFEVALRELEPSTQDDEECQSSPANYDEESRLQEAFTVVEETKEEAPNELSRQGCSDEHAVEGMSDKHLCYKAKELLKRCRKWLDAYPEEAERTYSSSYWKWFFSVLLRFLEGALCLTVTFILVVREETARDVLLNFTAVEFVSNIDNLCFGLAMMGYFGENVRADAGNKIIDEDNAQVKKPIELAFVPKRFKKIPFHAIVMFIIFIGLVSGWTAVVIKQRNGDYISEAVFVQFSDEYLPALGTYSGVYRRSGRGNAYRMMYEAVVSEDSQSALSHSEQAWLGYCPIHNENSGFWSLTIDGDPCSWLTRSSDSVSFEILDSATSQWYVKDGTRTVPIQHFTMVPFPGTEPCQGHGFFRNGVCECKDGWLGLDCGFNDTCTHLSLDVRKEEFFSGRKWVSDFDLYRDEEAKVVKVYGRPVFVKKTLSGQAEIIMFVGRRWVLYERSQNGMDQYLKQFHATFTKDFDVVFLSEAVDIGSPSDTITPLNLEWFHSADRTASHFRLPAVDSTSSTEAVLLCSVCNNTTNPCQNNGICVEGKCKCAVAAKGSICEDPPVGNGRCDEYLNTPEFDFDGGDCCESRCVSSQEYTCGKDDTGYADHGYFFCKDPVNVWRPNSIPLPGVSPVAQSGSSVALSENGAVLAVGDPGADTVRLFDKFGAEWVQRAQLVGPISSDFGRSVAVQLTSPSNIVSNPSDLASVNVAASGNKIARVYGCTTKGCQQIASDIKLSGTGNGLALSRDGVGMLVAVSSWSERWETAVQVFRSPESTGTWTQVGKTVGHDTTGSRYVAFSRDGKTLALGGYHNLAADTFIGNLKVEVYSWNEKMKDWDRLGDDKIESSSEVHGAELPSQSVALSGDSMVLAIGSIGSSPGVQVFVWNKTEEEWTERGALIVGADNRELVGWSVDLSFDGSIVAVGTGRGMVDGERSSIRVFRWNGTEHEQLWNGIPGGETSAISLSDDGSVLAVGLPFFEGNRRGTTIVYDFLSPNNNCSSTSALFRLSVTADDKANETSWDLRTSNETLLEGGFADGVGAFSTAVEEVCLEMEDCNIFTIYDTDGIDPPGGYIIFLNGTEHASGGDFSVYERRRIGNCSCDEEKEQFRAVIKHPDFVYWSLYDVAHGQTIVRGGGNQTWSRSAVEEEFCIEASDCLQLSIIKTHNGEGRKSEYEFFLGDDDSPVLQGYLFLMEETDRSNVTACPDTPIPPPAECDIGEVPVRVEVTQKLFHNYQAPWSLVSASTRDGAVETKLLLESAPGDPTMFDRTVVEQACVMPEECLKFSFGFGNYSSSHVDFEANTPGDYRLFYDGENITAWEGKPQIFGNCANVTFP